MLVRVRVLVPAMVGALILGGCDGSSGEGLPRDIVLGVDVCEYCHMIIDDIDRAAQWVETGGEFRVFDEAGDLVAWLKQGQRPGGRAWLADADGKGWIAAEDASFVSGAVSTAMAFDLVAFRDRARADSLVAARGGRVLDWGAVLNEGVEGDHAH